MCIAQSLTIHCYCCYLTAHMRAHSRVPHIQDYKVQYSRTTLRTRCVGYCYSNLSEHLACRVKDPYTLCFLRTQGVQEGSRRFAVVEPLGTGVQVPYRLVRLHRTSSHLPEQRECRVHTVCSGHSHEF